MRCHAQTRSLAAIAPGMKPHYLALMIGFNLLWGASFVIYKTVAPYLDSTQIVTLRFGIAAIGALAVWPLLPGRAPRGWDLVKSMLLGVAVFVAGHRMQVLGNQLGTAGNSAVLMAFEPVLTSVAAAFFLREHIAARRWVGFALAVLGVLLLNRVGSADFQWGSLTGSALVIASFLAEAAYSIVGKPIIARANLMKVLAVALMSGTAVNLALNGPATFAAARALPISGWVSLTALGVIGTTAGYGVWFLVIRETDVNLVAMTVFIQPLAGVPLAAMWLGEPLHAGQLWGGLAILTGLVVGLWTRTPAKAPSAGQ